MKNKNSVRINLAKSMVMGSLATLVILSPALAGVRLIGNGGGFAEMQAYSIDATILPLIEFCKSNPLACGLSSLESDLVQKLWNERARVFGKLLQINTSCREPYIHSHPDGASSIDSCLLHTGVESELGPVPKSGAEIGTLVFHLRLLYVASSAEAEALAVKLTQGLSVEDAQTSIGGATRNYRLHDWTLTSSLMTVRNLSIETAKATYDLKPDLEAAMGCAAQTWNLHSLEFLPEAQGKEEGRSQIHWSCSGRSYRGRLYFELFFENGEFVDSRLVILGKEAL